MLQSLNSGFARPPKLTSNPHLVSAMLAADGWSHGTSVSGINPSTNIGGGIDNKLQISVDGDIAEEITLTLTNCTSGQNIAAELQTKIQELGGKKAYVTVQFSNGLYVIKSSTYVAKSSVIINDAVTSNVADDLKLGKTNGGTETGGGQQTIINAAIYSCCAPGDVKIADNATDEEFLAWVYAQPRIVGQSRGSMTMRIVGDAPAIDIPVEIEVR